MKSAGAQAKHFLGIECGGTNSFALLVDDAGRVIATRKAGPANLRLLCDATLVKHFRSLALGMKSPAAIGIGMAGARTDSDRQRIWRAAALVWPGIPCCATNDLETALAAAQPDTHAAWRDWPRVLVLSGTGSCCFGRAPNGRTAKTGGWGHLLGDRGSGYDIGLRALQTVIAEFDRTGAWPPLGQHILRSLQVNEPNDLIAWTQSTDKTSVAAIAIEVFRAWSSGDKLAGRILRAAAERLTTDALACGRRLAGLRRPVVFVLSGSVLLKQPRWASQVRKALLQKRPDSVVQLQNNDSVWGAVRLAQSLIDSSGRDLAARNRPSNAGRSDDAASTKPFLHEALLRSPTEERNPRSRHLDKLSPREAIALVLREDATIPAALLAKRDEIARALNWIVRSLRQGGRLFYVGAGTSGRLGVLDASECPPTFRTPPEMVQGIIAGGDRALWQAVEGAEDDPAAGSRAIEFRGVNRRDVVVGIAASGRTPFVWGALWEAKRRGARTVLLCFNPYLKIPRSQQPHLIIAPNLGPEILTGSTRLKSGTATKLVLNIFTTLAMVRLGKVLGNLMIDVAATNMKLRERAVRMVRELTGANDAGAREALEKSGWLIRPAVRVADVLVRSGPSAARRKKSRGPPRS